MDVEELKNRIEEQVELTSDRIKLGGRTIDWFRVAEPDKLLQLAASKDSKADQARFDPFWSVAWRAAVGLDRYCQSLNLSGKRVLELGCGSGHAGIAAAIQGAHVTMTDIVQLAMWVAELNAAPVTDRIRFEKLDWDSDTIDEPPFEIILGSDLVYDVSLHRPLLACAARHLAPGGMLLLSEPFRHTGDHFAAWIKSQPWEVTEHRLDLDDARVPIRIFACRMILS
ncbi:MAG TPA: SAM-dependent methyltransferase [Planctomycetaceae bacterium]|nr:SAM-dependent methyltransferase [Planctomycetaceae bacterium]